MLTLVFLIIGAVVRNLAREEEMKMKNYEWRIKRGINRLLIKEMVLKFIVMVVAIFGPQGQFWPSILCCLITGAMTVYWLITMPYVIPKYNHIVGYPYLYALITL